MSIREKIRNAGFQTSAVSFRNTPKGTVATFPVMGAAYGWRQDVPVESIIPTMEFDRWFNQDRECDNE